MHAEGFVLNQIPQLFSLLPWQKHPTGRRVYFSLQCQGIQSIIVLKAWRWEWEAAWSYCISSRKAGRNECQDLANFFFFMEMVPASQLQLTQSSLTTCPELYLQGGSRFRQVNHQMITPTLCVFLLSFCLYYLSCLSPYYFTCLYVSVSPVSPFPFLVILYLSYLFLFLCVSPCLSHTQNQRQTIVFNAINIKTLDPKAVLVFQYQQIVFSCLYNSPVRGQLPTRQNLLYHESLALPLPPVPLPGTYRFTHSPPHSRRLSTHQILSQDEFWLSCH